MQLPTLPIWVLGLYFYLFSREGGPVRALGLVYVILFVLFMVQNARYCFLAPAYPVLFAAGALLADRFTTRRRWGWLRSAYVVVLAVSGVVVAPITVVPVLPVETPASITGSAGGDAGVQIETREVAEPPQNVADRFGWEGMTATVAGVYDDMPANERREACVFGGNYGEGGAIDFFGDKYGLPDSISGHNSYHVWGPGDCTGETAISVGVPRERLEGVFGEIEEAARVRCEYCMPD